MSTKKRKSDYTPRPNIDEEVHPEVLRRLEVISRVMSGQTSVTDAAAELGLSRNRFQTIYHRGLGAMMEELEEKPPGRPPKDPTIASLEAENARLASEVRSLTIQLDASRHATLNLAEMVRLQHSIGNSRSPRTRPSTKTETTSEADEDDPRRALLREQERMRAAGVPEELAAAAVATAASTLRHWRVRARRGEPLARRRGPASSPRASAAAIAAAEHFVRDVRGNVGAAALGKATGLSRREAAAVKAAVVTEMECERRLGSRRVNILVPGIVRGFDQMYVVTEGGWRFAFVSADASIPYRTSAHVAERYLADDVYDALEHDYEMNGAPLVERLDRAAAHRTPRVLELMRAHGVLPLHGPPRCPRYYGQLERQNRDHRAWLDDVEITDEAHLAAELSVMLRCLNDRIPRRSLGWCTPTQKWQARPPLTVDRAAFGDEVRERAAKISASLSAKERSLGYDQRFAIEQSLTAHGFLRVTNEGWR